MDDLSSRLLAITAVNGVIAVVQWQVRKQIPQIGRDGQFGIYLILLPLGFGMCGWDLPYLAIAPFVLAGLAILLYTMKKQLVTAQGSGRP